MKRVAGADLTAHTFRRTFWLHARSSDSAKELSLGTWRGTQLIPSLDRMSGAGAPPSWSVGSLGWLWTGSQGSRMTALRTPCRAVWEGGRVAGCDGPWPGHGTTIVWGGAVLETMPVLLSRGAVTAPGPAPLNAVPRSCLRH